MELKEIREERKKLELAITIMISDSIQEFINKTEVGVDRITIPMIDVTSLGDDKRKYVIGKAEVDLERI
jgi:hypothetical protein